MTALPLASVALVSAFGNFKWWAHFRMAKWQGKMRPFSLIILCWSCVNDNRANGTFHLLPYPVFLMDDCHFIQCSTNEPVCSTDTLSIGSVFLHNYKVSIMEHYFKRFCTIKHLKFSVSTIGGTHVWMSIFFFFCTLAEMTTSVEWLFEQVLFHFDVSCCNIIIFWLLKWASWAVVENQKPIWCNNLLRLLTHELISFWCTVEGKCGHSLTSNASSDSYCFALLFKCTQCVCMNLPLSLPSPFSTPSCLSPIRRHF